MNWPALATLDGGGDGRAADAGFDITENVAHAQAVAAHDVAFDGDFEIGFSERARRRDAGGAGDGRDDAGDFKGLGLECVQVVTEEFDADLRANAGARHQDAVLDGLEKAGNVTGDLYEALGEIGDDLVLGDAGTPFCGGFQHDGGLDHLDGRGIGGGVGAAEFASDGGDLGVTADGFVLPRHDALYLRKRGRGEEHGHEE